MSDAVTPSGMKLTATETNQVVVEFDHGDIPDIIVSAEAAERMGSQIVSAANRASGRDSPTYEWD